MNTAQILLLIGLLGLLISGLAIILGFVSIYKLRQNYPDYAINWDKNIGLFLIWGLIFTFNLGLLQYKNWGRLGLISVFTLLFLSLLLIIIFRLITYVSLSLKPSPTSNFPENITAINPEILPENKGQLPSEDLDELNYNQDNFYEEKDLDELNLSDDEGYYDEIYYLDNLLSNEDDFTQNQEAISLNNSLESYTKQGLIVTIIIAFIADVIIFTLISFLQSPEIRHLMVN